MNASLREHQLICVDALKELSRICRLYKIQYFLLAGSVLGAVRHKGFIPWDDDIDVGLLYEDFFRLRQALPGELSTKFRYVDDQVDSGYVWMFGKIMYGTVCCIDLFLISKWPSDPFEAHFRWQIRRLAIEYRKYALGYSLPAIVKETSLLGRIKSKLIIGLRYVLYMIVKNFTSPEDYMRLARWNERCLEEKNTELYINLYSIYTMKKEMLKKKWIDSIESLEFEGGVYPCIGCSEEYLTHLYGDYMVLPPGEKRIASHFNQQEENTNNQ